MFEDYFEEEFERGFNEAREHAADVKYELRKIAEGQSFDPSFKAELLAEGYIEEIGLDGDEFTAVQVKLTEGGRDYMGLPGLPSWARIVYGMRNK